MIGREMALDVGRGSYRPDVAIHLTGIANSGPDHLSRTSMPGYDGTLPSYLRGMPRVLPPVRDASFS